ncbi:MAG: hypothetical protein KC486_28815 [Myxococcales bacterium]|nr:hypothetical protein [Myxococcales bacterium]
MIARPLPRALRVLVALVLWIGVSVSAVWSPPADARPAVADTGPTVDHWVALLDYLGGSRICGDDEVHEEVEVFCGGDLLAERLMIDPKLLVMSSGTCSRLLEQLFGDQTCDPLREECGGVHHSGVPPPARSLSVPSTTSVALRDPRPASWRLGEALASARASSDRTPPSFVIAPPSPPPRAALSLV